MNTATANKHHEKLILELKSNNLRAGSACEEACDNALQIRPARELCVQKAFQNDVEVSFHGKDPHAAFSFLVRAKLGQHYCHER